MNLPSPDEQLDLHGPRAQLPFEQIPPQSRAGIKSSHETLENDLTPMASNGVITSGGPPDEPRHVSGVLVSPELKRPDPASRATIEPELAANPRDNAGADAGKGQQHHIPEEMASEAMDKQTCEIKTDAGKRFVSFEWSWTNIMSAHPQQDSHAQGIPQSNPYLRPLMEQHAGNSPAGFGTFGNKQHGQHGQDGGEEPPSCGQRLVRSFGRFMTVFRRFLGFVGPGYIVSVGYMDPGNWATDLAAGSSFGYMHLFVILCSNLMAVVLQGLAVKLGVVSGLDLAQACRMFTPKYVNWFLYVLAELAIIACDLAEVIGSAIALNLLFKIPLPWGVVITAADVLIILFAFRDDQSVKSRRFFEALVIVLVTIVGVCFTIEIVYSEPVAVDVLKGFLPDVEILTNREALYLAIGIIGATVMPHNLYLHSNIVKLRTRRELNKLASSQSSMSSTQDLMSEEQRALAEEDKGTVSVKHSTIKTTLRYTFWDSTVALTFALYVNSAILIVSAATFKYKFPDADNSGLADFFDAFDLLGQYLGRAASYLFAVALLMAGQSSTLTATLAGQIIMEGFLGTSYLKPWVRRLLTRSLAIIPALAIVLIKGKSGLSELLLASQVALSIQLPFAVIPLVFFTSMGRCMTIPVQDNEDKPGIMDYGFSDDFKQDPKRPSGESSEVSDENGQAQGKQLLHNFANPWWLVIIAGFISIILLCLNFYLLVQTIRGV
ncbi:hypothetical protein BGW38_005862 [Lunasporangiospora selenospora]|uniref:Uncharacterized protein n=1 Tax=Lunasporangiospora selenospora TaxID=979761 RepID=A0A9P6FZE3_9FUNG|nr:hypothetical protein BGW38_005862 [Lunasporangiospora selenospora]